MGIRVLELSNLVGNHHPRLLSLRLKEDSRLRRKSSRKLTSLDLLLRFLDTLLLAKKSPKNPQLALDPKLLLLQVKTFLVQELPRSDLCANSRNLSTGTRSKRERS